MPPSTPPYPFLRPSRHDFTPWRPFAQPLSRFCHRLPITSDSDTSSPACRRFPCLCTCCQCLLSHFLTLYFHPFFFSFSSSSFLFLLFFLSAFFFFDEGRLRGGWHVAFSQRVIRLSTTIGKIYRQTSPLAVGNNRRTSSTFCAFMILFLKKQFDVSRRGYGRPILYESITPSACFHRLLSYALCRCGYRLVVNSSVISHEFRAHFPSLSLAIDHRKCSNIWSITKHCRMLYHQV